MTWRATTLSAFAGLTLLLAACGGPPPLPEATSAVDPGSPQDSIEGYPLDSGDIVRVTVFREPDLTNDYELDGLGNISMPLIGAVAAKGLTARQLEQQISQQYSDGILVDPQVSAQVLTYRPFFVLGEVNNPGSYEYLSGMTVAQAVALAGGYTYRASQSGITLQRGGSEGDTYSAPEDSTVLPGDIVRVPERFF